jgi:hypothetical protein
MQTFLRALGIHVAFSREGRAGNRIIRIQKACENSVSIVGTASSVFDHRQDSPQTAPAPVQLVAGASFISVARWWPVSGVAYRFPAEPVRSTAASISTI